MLKIGGIYHGVIAALVLLAGLLLLPGRSLVVLARESGYPNLDLAEASNARTGHYERGVVMLSLRPDGIWLGRGEDTISREHLEYYLNLRGEEWRARGIEPYLKVRIDGDEAAGYLLDAAVTAQRLGYGRLMVAVYETEVRNGR